MTEKFNKVNEYCNRIIKKNQKDNNFCTNCNIKNICNACGGNFLDNELAVNMAYNIIIEGENKMEEKAVPTRATILRQAEKCIIGDRDEDYGTPEHSFECIGKLWSAYLNLNITPMDVANMMVLFKVARTKTGHGKKDNWIDMAGYAACGGEIENNYISN